MRSLIMATAMASCLPFSAAFAEDAVRTMVITGSAEVAAKPDMARISLGVTQQGKTADQALAAMSDQVAKVLAYLETAGIAPEDMQTSGLSLSPRYASRDSTPSDQAPAIVGYVAAMSISVTVQELDQLGTLLDASVKSGANRMNGLSFAVEDPGDLLDEARRAAVADAMARAEVLADAAGVGLGAIQSISESSGGGMPYAADMRMIEAAAAVPVAEGAVNYSANVTIVFEIN